MTAVDVLVRVLAFLAFVAAIAWALDLLPWQRRQP